jgi:hypothetical protein
MNVMLTLLTAPLLAAALDAPVAESPLPEIAAPAIAESNSAATPSEPAIQPPRVVFPPDRPSWLESEPVREGPVHRTYVSSGPHFRQRECTLALDEELKHATDEYVDEYLGSNASRFINFDLNYIKTNLLDPDLKYSGIVQFDFAPMREEHRCLVFDGKFRNELDEHWKQAVTTSRVTNTGLVAGGVLALLGVIFSFFRLDTATRGFYTGRLQFAAAAAILTLVVAGVVAARWVPWM